MFWYSHALMIIHFNVHILWWSFAHKSTCLDYHKLLCSHVLIFTYFYVTCFDVHTYLCSHALTIICSHVYLLRWSYAFMFTCFDNHILPCSHAFMIIHFYVHMLWWSYAPTSTCFKENMPTCIYAFMLICSCTFWLGAPMLTCITNIHYRDIHEHVHTHEWRYIYMLRDWKTRIVGCLGPHMLWWSCINPKVIGR